MIYQMQITVMVEANNPTDAMKTVVEEFDYLFELDNNLIAYTHPTHATEETMGGQA